jgi:hypothetical protein
MTASDFLTALIAAVPYKIHIVLTDTGIQFRFPPHYADGPSARFVTHMFGLRCREQGSEYRSIKEATMQRYHYDGHEQLEHHLDDVIRAYNFGRRLKTLKRSTPIGAQGIRI